MNLLYTGCVYFYSRPLRSLRLDKRSDRKPYSMTSSKLKRVGLTGNIGSGKSTVAQMLVERGAALIDSDALAKEATRDPDVLQSIADALGDDLIRNGELDRPKTAERVFGDEEARETLSGIIHPWVRRKSEERAEALERQDAPPKVVLMDIPLLYENALERGLDAVVVVDAPLEVRVKRVQERSGLSEQEVRARDAAQMPLEKKVERADYVVDNSGDKRALEPQLERLWSQLTS